MAERYRITGAGRIANRVMAAFARPGCGPPSTHLLTVTGRKSGQPRTTPVTLVQKDGRRWLVAPYGPVAWVHNVPAARHPGFSLR